jgi:hypothetical protein
MTDTIAPYVSESGYRHALKEWMALPTYASAEKHQEVFMAVIQAEAALSAGRPTEVLEEELSSFWAQEGRCGLCGTKQDDMNAHLGRRIVSNAVGGKRKR